MPRKRRHGDEPAESPGEEEWLRLENQICFPFYAVSRLIIRRYQPLLEDLDLTYPQYLVLLVLWENDGVPIQVLSDQLLLNTNTLSPLLKRLEGRHVITRRRESEDDRVVTIRLTTAGRRLRKKALSVSKALVDDIDYPLEEARDLHKAIWKFLEALKEQP